MCKSTLAMMAGLFGLTVIPLAHAGARIDLRPTPPQPPGGYAPNTVIDVVVFAIDTGNPFASIPISSMILDFGASSSSLTFPGANATPGDGDDNLFHWEPPFPDFTFFLAEIPLTGFTTTVDFTDPTPFYLTIPEGGEVRLGHILVNVGATGGLLDAFNVQNLDPGHGASANVFVHPESYIWTAGSGALTGGRLRIVVPEPTMLSLCAAALLGLTARRIYRAL